MPPRARHGFLLGDTTSAIPASSHLAKASNRAAAHERLRGTHAGLVDPVPMGSHVGQRLAPKADVWFLGNGASFEHDERR
jgi:hypothetical protein